MAVPQEGKAAPAFALPAHPKGKVALKDYKGKQHVVLYFYPKDMTSGCTQEAVGFQTDLDAFAKAGVVVLGVSPDDLASHAKFAEKQGLQFPLLSDTDQKVATQYGVWKEKSMYGRKFMGIERTTFVIDKTGKIRKVYPKVKVAGHAEAVLEFVQGMA